MMRSDHLDDGALMRLLDGVSDADAAPGLAEMREHVSDCSGCRARLGELAEGDRLWKGALAGSSRLQAPAFEVRSHGRGRGRRRLLAVAAVLAVLAAVPPVRAAVGSAWGWIREHLAPAAMVETTAVPPSPSAEVGEDALELQVAGRWLTLDLPGGAARGAMLRVVPSGGEVGVLHLGGPGRARLSISGDTLRLASVAGVTYRLELPSTLAGLTVTVEDSVVLRRAGSALLRELPLEVPLAPGSSP